MKPKDPESVDQYMQPQGVLTHCVCVSLHELRRRLRDRETLLRAPFSSILAAGIIGPQSVGSNDAASGSSRQPSYSTRLSEWEQGRHKSSCENTFKQHGWCEQPGDPSAPRLSLFLRNGFAEALAQDDRVKTIAHLETPVPQHAS